VLGGVLMDVAGVGTPFAVAGILLLLALPLTVGLERVATGDATH
jgi:predicted MFS family arabinose efflux permease